MSGSAAGIDARAARAALCRLGEPGDGRLAGAVEDLGPVTAYEAILAQQGGGDLAAEAGQRLGAIDPVADLARAEARGIRFVVPEDEEWPSAVDRLSGVPAVAGRTGPPLGLWVRGPLRLDEALERAVAVVGARSSTTYGDEVAREIGATVAGAGWTTVSGAAYGIDQAAHRGALATRGPTIAVLACGVDRSYPSGHADLIAYIAETGLVVSELAPGCSPTRLRFLARNRLIAAFAAGTVVVEAALRSGSLNTASWAYRLNLPVMGVPGPVTSATSAGVHELIRSREALLVTSGAEVLDVVAPAGEHVVSVPRGESRPHDSLSLVDQRVLDAVPAVRPAPSERIARTAGVAPVVVEPSLGRLVRAGLVERAGHGHRLRREGGP